MYFAQDEPSPRLNSQTDDLRTCRGQFRPRNGQGADATAPPASTPSVGTLMNIIKRSRRVMEPASLVSGTVGSDSGDA